MTETCPLCGSPETQGAYLFTGYEIARCGACRFEFQPEFQGGGSDEEMFSDDYYRVVHREAFKEQFGDYECDPSIPIYDRWLGRIEEAVPVGRILDVGSALGTFLKVSESRGWDPQGVEISRFASEFSRTERGLSVFNGDLGGFGGEDGTFDAVTFWDSIEHVAAPRENLTAAVRLTRSGGALLFTTDNFDCLFGDVARLIYRLSGGRFQYPMERVFIDRNRSYFSERTFRKFLSSEGLEILAIEKMEYPLRKIRTNWLEHMILRGFYAAGWLLKRPAQITVLARKA